MSIVRPTEARRPPTAGRWTQYDRAPLSAIVQQVRDGRSRTNIGSVSTLYDDVAFNATERRGQKMVISVRQGATRLERGRWSSTYGLLLALAFACEGALPGF